MTSYLLGTADDRWYTSTESHGSFITCGPRLKGPSLYFLVGGVYSLVVKHRNAENR